MGEHISHKLYFFIFVLYYLIKLKPTHFSDAWLSGVGFADQ